MKVQILFQVYPPHKCRLGDCPCHRISGRQVFHAPPEVTGSIMIVTGFQPSGIAPNRTERYVIRHSPQSGYLCIKSHPGLDQIIILPWQKVDGIPGISKLICLLLLPKHIQLFLHGRRIIFRCKEPNIFTKTVNVEISSHFLTHFFLHHFFSPQFHPPFFESVSADLLLHVLLSERSAEYKNFLPASCL